MFSLDYRSRLPIYEQLYQSILRRAALGGTEADEQLPSVRAMAQELGVNPNTVQKAYHLLERDGIICSVPGKGSFMSPSAAAIKLRRTQALQKLGDAARACLDAGIEKETILDCVQQSVQGGKPNND